MTKTYFVLLLSALLIFGASDAAFGQMMSSGVGVAKGQVFTFSYRCYFLSNDPNAVSPSEFSWINQTDYCMINVTAVSGSTVNYETTLHMQNGSSIMGVGSMNVGNGFSMMSGYTSMGMNNYYFMSSNVGMMGRMFPSASISPTVNGTLMMSYAGGQRLTNMFSMVATKNGLMNQSDYYFDQATGAMVQWHQQILQTHGSLQTNSTQMMKLTSSSVWTVPEFPPTAILSFLIVTLFAMFILKLKKPNLKKAIMLV